MQHQYYYFGSEFSTMTERLLGRWKCQLGKITNGFPVKVVDYVFVHHSEAWGLSSFFFECSEGSLWQTASKLNSHLRSENERLKQLTDDLKQRHSQMTSEVNIVHCYSSVNSSSAVIKIIVEKRLVKTLLLLPHEWDFLLGNYIVDTCCSVSSSSVYK